MEVYKICQVICHLMFLPNWITSKTLPDDKHTNYTNTTGDLHEFANHNITHVSATPSGNYTSQDYFENNTSNENQTKPSRTTSIYMYATSPETQKTTSKDEILLTQTTNIHSQEEDKTTDSTVHTTAKLANGIKWNRITKSNKTITQENSVVEKLSFEVSYNNSVTDNFTISSRNNFSETISSISPEVTNSHTFNDEKTIIHHTPSEKDEITLQSETMSNSLGKTTPTAAATTTSVPKHATTAHPYHKHIKNVWIGEKARGRMHKSSMHHLSLVPIEDGPFGSLIWRDKKYLITVLVPIGIGIVGAACIIGMAYVVRFCHRNEGKMQEIRENIQKRFTAQNDQVILLTNSSDEEF